MSTDLIVTNEQLDLVKRTIAKDATTEELRLFLYDCHRQGVHPLDRLLHFTKRKGKYTPITSIDLMRTRAADTGEYAGSDDAVFVEGPNSLPISATVTVWRLVQGQRCAFTSTARWKEYCPDPGPSGNADAMWRKMPHSQLAKCTEALSLRKGFPRQLAGLYATEEMDQAADAVPKMITVETIEPPATPPPPPAPAMATVAQCATIVALCTLRKKDEQRVCLHISGGRVGQSTDLYADEAARLIASLGDNVEATVAQVHGIEEAFANVGFGNALLIRADLFARLKYPDTEKDFTWNEADWLLRDLVTNPPKPPPAEPQETAA